MDDVDAARKVRDSLIAYRRKTIACMAASPVCSDRKALTSAMALRDVQADIEMLDRIIAEEETHLREQQGYNHPVAFAQTRPI